MLKRSTARIKALSRKRFTAGAGNKFNQQMYRYMRSAAYQSVSTGGGIINTAKNVLSYAYWSVRMAANGIGAILGALFGAIGVLIIPVIIIIAVICTISGGSKGENASVGSLTGDEATIAQYLIDKGVDRTHIAAIMGNMFQESGCHPTALNSSSGAYGICQWLGGRKTGLENLAKEKGKDMSDLSVQLDWFWEEFAESCSGWNKAKYKVFCAQSDLKQCVYLFRSQFERCGESEAADANRLAQAQRIYDALGTSSFVNKSVVMPTAASILSLVMLIQLIKISQRIDGTATLPAIKDIVFLIIYATIFIWLLKNSLKICAGAYDLFNEMIGKINQSTVDELKTVTIADSCKESFGAVIGIWVQSMIFDLITIIIKGSVSVMHQSVLSRRST